MTAKMVLILVVSAAWIIGMCAIEQYASAAGFAIAFVFGNAMARAERR